MWRVGAVAFLVLAGCVADPPPEETATSAPPLDPLPPPADVHPDSIVGSTVVQDPGFDNATTGPLPWRNECIRHWQSGAYSFHEPPVVRGKPCLFYPTAEGTLHWFVLDGKWEGVPIRAYPLPREDGFFDWVYLDAGSKRLLWLENGTSPVPVADVAVADPDRVTLSAVRTGSTVHVTAVGFTGLSSAPGATHVWFEPGGQSHTERISGLRSIGDPGRLRTDGTTAIYVSGGYEASTIYLGSQAFEAHGFPGLYVLSADIHDGEVWACAARAQTYFALHGVASETGWLWTLEPVAPRPLADLAFTCGAAATSQGPTVVFDSPRLDGGSPFHPLGGSQAASRRGPVWSTAPVGFDFHSGADLTAVRDVVVHLGETANGTSTGNWQNGTELRMGPGGDPTQGPWTRFWGNFGRTTMFVPHAERLLVVGEMWANPPFEYPGFPQDKQVSWAVVEIPLPGPPT